MILLYLTGVLLDISYLPFVQNQNYQYSGKVSKGAKIRNRYNQVHYLIQDTNGKVTNSQIDTTNESLEVSPFPAGDHKEQISSRFIEVELNASIALAWFLSEVSHYKTKANLQQRGHN